jgi:DNA-binding NarL/FixJ family response regulator
VSAARTVGTGFPHLLPASRRFAEKGSISVLIADRDPMSAELLATALKHYRAIQVTGSSTNRSDISAAIARRSPEVLVISSDLEDGRESGFRVMRELREAAPGINLVALLDSSSPESVVEAFWSGAHGVFIRSSSVKALAKCICCVQKGQIWANSEQMRLLLETLTRSALPRPINSAAMHLLTPREQDVLGCLSDGLSNREIAQRLGLSHHTVKNYLLHIFEKLGVSSRVEALLRAHAPDHPRVTKEAPADRKTVNDLRMDTTKSMFDFHREGARQDFPSAPSVPIHFYQSVHPNEPDPVTAYVWHELARATSDRLSDRSREARDRLATSMTPEQLTTAKRLIEGWSHWFDAIFPSEDSGELAAWSRQQSRRAATI